MICIHFPYYNIIMIGYILIKCNINYDILLLYYTSKEKKYIYINIYIYKFIYKITIIKKKKKKKKTTIIINMWVYRFLKFHFNLLVKL